jgi:cytochrome c553
MHCQRPFRFLASSLLLILLPLAAPLRAAERPAVLPDTMAQRLLACTSCHARADTAHGTEYFPRISGKPAGYLYNQLVNFRDGRRQYPVMTYMVTHLPDPYGRILAMQGDPARRIPACIACHGQALTGVLPAVPGLVGLPRDYVNAQFGAWRNHTRKAAQPDCMATIAARLTLDDINAVSTWLARQPFSPDARPAAAMAQPLPLACGSVP